MAGNGGIIGPVNKTSFGKCKVTSKTATGKITAQPGTRIIDYLIIGGGGGGGAGQSSGPGCNGAGGGGGGIAEAVEVVVATELIHVFLCLMQP